MKVFLSHSSNDKDVVKSIGYWLKKEKNINVWFDDWEMTAGDSLIVKISEGIETADKLVVFLSESSVESEWVKKEVNNGVIMEIAQEKGFGEKFVIPALLNPCKIPFFLKEKLYADFTNKNLSSACEELYRGITNTKLEVSHIENYENRIIRFNTLQGKQYPYALLVEFGVRVSPMEGLHIKINLGSEYKIVEEWCYIPNCRDIPEHRIGSFKDLLIFQNPISTIFEKKFSDPSINSSKSYYLYFESNIPFKFEKILFTDYYERII